MKAPVLTLLDRAGWWNDWRTWSIICGCGRGFIARREPPRIRNVTGRRATARCVGHIAPSDIGIDFLLDVALVTPTNRPGWI
jgi:hypothetical protein